MHGHIWPAGHGSGGARHIYFMGVVSECPIRLSGIEKRPFFGGCFCTKAVVISIRATDFVRCRQVVLLSDGDGPLWEVQLYDR